MAALAARAAGANPAAGDLFGLLANAGTHTFAIPMQPNAHSANTGGGPAGVQGPTGTQGGAGGSAGAGSGPAGAQGPTANKDTGKGTGGKNAGGGQPAGNPAAQYDVSADPVLQQVNAAMTLADQNAQAGALRSRQQALLAYGDSDLASKILGASDPLATAAGLNQEGTVEQLLRGYQSGLHNFDQQLDPSLAYSGYRVGGEGEIGQGYQDSLSQAAQAINAQLGGYTDTLNNALASAQQQRVQALADAYNRAVQAALAGGG